MKNLSKDGMKKVVGGFMGSGSAGCWAYCLKGSPKQYKVEIDDCVIGCVATDNDGVSCVNPGKEKSCED